MRRLIVTLIAIVAVSAIIVGPAMAHVRSAQSGHRADSSEQDRWQSVPARECFVQGIHDQRRRRPMSFVWIVFQRFADNLRQLQRCFVPRTVIHNERHHLGHWSF